MPLEYPYQVVTFLKAQPSQYEPVYSGPAGWYPQVALKRRFKLENISEDQLIDLLVSFSQTTSLPSVITSTLQSVDNMPVRVIPIANKDELCDYHDKLQSVLLGHISSRFPDREGANYFPHVTAEYDGELVIDARSLENKTLQPKNVWLLKDVVDENSIAYRRIA